MKNKYLPIIIILLFFLLIGVVIVSDYGESYDEYLHVQYGENTFQNYISLFSSVEQKVTGPDDLQYYGPFFDLLINLGTQFIQIFIPGLSIITIRHIFYYLSFLVAAGSVYTISSNLFKTQTALLTTVLFIIQPVLWGHAFINPKDMPFMSAFLLSIAVGLSASKKIVPLIDSFHINERSGIFKNIEIEWNTLKNKRTVSILFNTFFMSIFFMWLGHGQINNLIERLIHDFYINKDSFLGILFSKYAINATTIPATAYIAKTMLLAKRFFTFYIVGGILLFFVWVAMLLPKSRVFFWDQKAKPFLIDLFASLKNPWIFITGFCIGIATAIRILGPFAGLLIGAYYLLLYKRKSIPAIIAIGSIAILVTYIFWPYLWTSPIKHFYESLTVMSDFPWNGQILFFGEFYNSSALPRIYLPLLLLIQLTEPVMFLFFTGAILATIKIVNKEKHRNIWVLIFVWFLVPLLLIVLFTPILYDNFRQTLFIIPPIFLFAGLGLDFILGKIKSNPIQWGIIFLILLPGLYATITLHPYQYIYYNSYVGGTEGAFRRFEADYWVTSFGEATEFLNENAGENSRILVWGNHLIVKRIARDDLIVEPLHGGTYDLDTGYDFGIQSTRWNRDLNNFPDAPILFSIEKDGAILAVVKQLRCTEINPCP